MDGDAIHGTSVRVASLFTRELGFEITTRCPLSCAHCIVESSPRRKEVAASALQDWVADAMAFAQLDTVVATGGEPFLYPDTLAFLANATHAHGCAFRVITSAAWARRAATARTILARVPVDHLVISYDTFHAAYLPFDRVCVAVAAGVETGAKVTLNVCAPIIDLDEELNARAAALHDAVGATTYSQVEVTGQPLLLAGRARCSADGGREKWDVFDSCEMAARHVVRTDGTVIACCGPPAYEPGYREGPLAVGDLGQDSMADVLARTRRNFLVRAVHVLGPAYLYELAGAAAQRVGEYFDTKCALCTSLLRDAELLTTIEARLADPMVRQHVALAVALRSGDLELLNDVRPFQTVTPSHSTAESSQASRRRASSHA